MSRFLGLIGILALLVTSLAFAYLNSGHRVTLRLGVVTLYSVPLTVVVFGSVIVGMVVMLVAGIRSDLKVRRILRARLAEEDREERERFVDQSQQDLFAQADALGDPPLRADESAPAAAGPALPFATPARSSEEGASRVDRGASPFEEEASRVDRDAPRFDELASPPDRASSPFEGPARGSDGPELDDPDPEDGSRTV